MLLAGRKAIFASANHALQDASFPPREGLEKNTASGLACVKPGASGLACAKPGGGTVVGWDFVVPVLYGAL